MTLDNFLQFMKHFVAHPRCPTTEKVLLQLHNHESHTDLSVIESPYNKSCVSWIKPIQEKQFQYMMLQGLLVQLIQRLLLPQTFSQVLELQAFIHLTGAMV